MNKLLDSLHKKILNHKFAEVVSEDEIMALVDAKNNGWIPCSERLPERCISVLIQDKEKIVIGFCDTDNKWYGIYGSIILGNVIAWQPLPPEYEPKGE